jgi:putative methionine-R-sulfoxide reductase with GAF domain
VNFDPYTQYLTQLLSQNELHKLNSVLKNKFSSINWNGFLMKVAGLSVKNAFFGNYPASQSNIKEKNWVEKANDRTLRSWINDLENNF